MYQIKSKKVGKKWKEKLILIAVSKNKNTVIRKGYFSVTVVTFHHMLCFWIRSFAQRWRNAFLLTNIYSEIYHTLIQRFPFITHTRIKHAWLGEKNRHQSQRSKFCVLFVRTKCSSSGFTKGGSFDTTPSKLGANSSTVLMTVTASC